MITQVLIDSLIRASELALLAVGLTMIYDVLRFPIFAHVEFGTTGAFIAVAVSTALPLGPVPAVLIGAVVALAIKKAGSAETDAIRDALQAVSQNYKGVTGNKAFDDDGMQTDEEYAKLFFKDGKLRPYEMK